MVNTEEIRSLLTARADAIDGTRSQRVDEVFRRVRTQRRRRTAVAIAGATCAVLAMVLGSALLSGHQNGSSDPVAPATTSPADPGPQSPVRPVTYTDEYWPTRTIQYGDRAVDITAQLEFGDPGRGGIDGVVHMDMTDDGIVFTTEGGGIWFTDGSSTHQIGETNGYLGIRASDVVVSGTDGSRVAWVAEAVKPRKVEIVVYDTRADRVVAKVPDPACAELITSCAMKALVGDDHVYWVRADWRHARPDVLTRLEVSNGTRQRVTAAELAADLASTPRALIVGDSPQTGVVSDGYGVVFAVKGARLVAMRSGLAPDDPYNSATTAFKASTQEQLRFRMPAGYNGGADEFTAFEWLDDDRLAMMNAANSWRQTTAEILICRVSTGHCELAAGANSGDDPRIAPHIGLPG
jgi:hypothetical protein